MEALPRAVLGNVSNEGTEAKASGLRVWRFDKHFCHDTGVVATDFYFGSWDLLNEIKFLSLGHITRLLLY
jgi:hypothetical protein